MLKSAAVVVLIGSAFVAGIQPSRSAPVAESATRSPLSIEAMAAVPQTAVHYIAAGDGNVARYRVRERLVGKELDNDAIGETTQLSGAIAIDKAGKIVPGVSQFTATLTEIKSDSDRRDGYVRRRILVVDSFPSTKFVVTGVQGLPAKLPTSGTAEFQLSGNLTVKGVTRASTWQVTATVSGDRLTGSAVTKFTFAEFQLTQPKVPIVLSVVDTITLEYDFAMTKKAP